MNASLLFGWPINTFGKEVSTEEQIQSFTVSSSKLLIPASFIFSRQLEGSVMLFCLVEQNLRRSSR